MSKSLQIELKEDPQALVARAKAIAHKEGISFRGDRTGGNIDGKGFHGNYKIDNNMIILTIHKKPALLPWKLLISKIKSFFREAHG